MSEGGRAPAAILARAAVSWSIAFWMSSMLVERFALLSRSSTCSRRSSMVEAEVPLFASGSVWGGVGAESVAGGGIAVGCPAGGAIAAHGRVLVAVRAWCWSGWRSGFAIDGADRGMTCGAASFLLSCISPDASIHSTPRTCLPPPLTMHNTRRDIAFVSSPYASSHLTNRGRRRHSRPALAQ